MAILHIAKVFLHITADLIRKYTILLLQDLHIVQGPVCMVTVYVRTITGLLHIVTVLLHIATVLYKTADLNHNSLHHSTPAHCRSTQCIIVGLLRCTKLLRITTILLPLASELPSILATLQHIFTRILNDCYRNAVIGATDI